MNKLNIYITLIIIVKIIFIILAVYGLFLKYKKSSNKKKIDDIQFWKERVEFIFIIMMALLLIYLFNPRSNRLNLINYETKLLFYLFGFILIITAKWQVFIGESIFLKKIQTSLGNEGSK